MKVQHEIFFVMGEANFLATLSETSSEKRRLYFEPVVSHGTYLGRHSTLGEGSISLRGSLEAVDGAPSTCCAKHSSVIFSIFSSAGFHARKILDGPSEGLRRPQKGLSRIFRAPNPALEEFGKVHRRVLRTTRRWRSFDRPK